MSNEKRDKHNSYSFRLVGMQCKSCGDLVKQELSELSYVSSVEVDYHNNIVKVSGDFVGIPPKALAKDFSYMLAEFGIALQYTK